MRIITKTINNVDRTNNIDSFYKIKSVNKSNKIKKHKRNIN